MARLVVDGAHLVLDEAAAKIHFGGESVVRTAAQREIRGRVLAVEGEWFQMVKLEAMRLGAASSAGLHVTTASFVTRKDGAPNGRGDVTPALAREVALGMRKWAPRGLDV
jgi:hypothetical protein